MKCQKCGAEIPAGSKFCNECGTKIEQVALFKDIEPESKEPYKCEKCGKIIPSNSVFCPECRAYQKNKFNPTSDTEKSSDKKPIYRTSHFYIALLIVLILCAVVVTAISQVSQPTPQETETTIQLTTEDSYYSYEEETTAYSEMAEYYMGTVGYQVPDSWKTKKSDGSHHYHYNIFDELFFVGCTKLESDKIKLDDTLIDELIKSDKETYDNYKEQSKEIIDMCGCKTLHRTFKCSEKGNDKFYNSYIFITDGYLYLMSFNSDGDKQSPNFDRYEKQIIDSIVIDSYDDFEDETEPPTEKPTEFEDTLTELYSDSDIAVYYSDTEKYPYSDDEADVHFYVKNKMDKSITIQADTVILDGRSYNQVVCSDPISAHSEGMIEVSIDNCKNFNPSTVGADLRYFDSDNFGSTVKMNLISKKVK